MGIRVNKVIGYGVKNLKPDDPRIDWEELHHSEHREKRGDTDMSQFIRWLGTKKVQKRLFELHLREYPGIDDGMQRFLRSDTKFLTQNIKTQMKNHPSAWMYLRGGPAACLIHDGEGRENVMVFLQPDAPDWHRHDDIMDYYEEHGRDGPIDRVKDLTPQGGIHPYNVGMIRFRKPSKGVYPDFEKDSFGDHPEIKLDEHGMLSMSVGTYNRLVGRWDPKLPPLVDKKRLLHLKRPWRPKVPLGVLAVLLWHDCFPDLEGFIDDLRPMMYVWWG